MNWDEKILVFLSGVGGFSTGYVARAVQPQFGHNARTHSAFIRGRLLDLEKRGFVCRLDDRKPVCWVKT